MDTRWRNYRSSLPGVWRWLAGLCAALGAFNALFVFLLAPVHVALPLGLMALSPTILLGLAIAYFRVYVSPMALMSYTFWGKYATTPWNAITSVEPGSVFGLKYLRVRATACRSELWVPLYLSDMPGFNRFVREHAGQTNPLVIALEAK
jgi:hypothetical protein